MSSEKLVETTSGWRVTDSTQGLITGGTHKRELANKERKERKVDFGDRRNSMVKGMVGGSMSIFRGWLDDFFGFVFEVSQVLPSAAVIRNSRITELLITSSPRLSGGRIRLTFRLKVFSRFVSRFVSDTRFLAGFRRFFVSRICSRLEKG